MPQSIADPQLPLQSIIPTYPYQQYADDPNIVVWFNVQNQLLQGYLDWFNSTPLAVYTSPQINGQLLDIIGAGIYGIERPVFSTLNTKIITNAIDAEPIDAMAINSTTHQSSGSAVIANDDFYKRVLTWCTYIGDGRIFNFSVLRLKVARFLFGVNGGDATLSQAQAVQVAVGSSAVKVNITIPTSQAAQFFQQGIAAGTLPFPFQLTPVVTLV